MMRSLSSAVAGLRTHQTKMDVIGNNIANVNTYGFKASRTTFADVYYQNLSSGRSGTTGTRGGTNPTQIGYGASVATIDVMNTVSSAKSTDRALDVYITGEGFLVSKDAAGQIMYSRLGNMTFDSAGNLVDGNGNRIQGFPMKADGTPNISPDGTLNSDLMTGIWVSPDILEKLKSISISNTGAITGLLEGERQISARSTNPSWMNSNSMTIPDTSVYNGSVRLAVSGFCDVGTMETALGVTGGGIKSMEMGTVALPESANYKVTVDASGNVKVTLPASTAADLPDKWDAISLSGSLKNGQLVLANKKGDVAMTITFDDTVKLTSTSVTSAGTAPTTTLDVSTIQSGSMVAYYQLTDPTDPTSGVQVTNGTDPLWVTAAADDGKGNVDLTKPLYEEDPLNPGTYIPLLDGSGNPMYAAYTTTPTSTTTDPGRTLALTLHAQMTATDKGGNIIKDPATPQPFAYAVGAMAQFDELSFEVVGAPSKGGFNDIIGTAEPGDSIVIDIGNIVLAKFSNPSGMDQVGTSYFTESLNSGSAIYVIPGLEGTGGLKSGYLEQSNVDISNEFTDMITTQRGFQANSRIISVSDEMLQELVNLKR